MSEHAFKSKQMIVMRRDLKMRKGKIAAQAGHACVEAVLMALARENRLAQAGIDEVAQSTLPMRAPPPHRSRTGLTPGWPRSASTSMARRRCSTCYEQGRQAGFAVALIRDAGLTEFHGEPTFTCLAFEPLYPSQIDPLTGDLPLLSGAAGESRHPRGRKASRVAAAAGTIALRDELFSGIIDGKAVGLLHVAHRIAVRTMKTHAPRG